MREHLKVETIAGIAIEKVSDIILFAQLIGTQAIWSVFAKQVTYKILPFANNYFKNSHSRN